MCSLVQNNAQSALHFFGLEHVEFAIAAKGQNSVYTMIDNEIDLAAQTGFIHIFVLVYRGQNGNNNSFNKAGIHSIILTFYLKIHRYEPSPL